MKHQTRTFYTVVSQFNSRYAVLPIATALLLFGIAGIHSVSAQSTQPSVQDDAAPAPRHVKAGYAWTTDHMQVGVRWQPFPGRPANNAYDAARPVIAVDSSYVQFWVAWPAAEPTPAHTNYAQHLSTYLKTIETAVDACVAKGLKVELVFFHCPDWASESGNQGGWKPKLDHYAAFVERIARHFKGRVAGYQLSHESNLKGFMKDGDIDYLISEIYIKGARAIRRVYNAAPVEPVIISTTGCSPCQGCAVMSGLQGIGGEAVNDFYDQQIANAELMQLVDAVNLNVTDHYDGYGNMDGSFVSSAWGNYDLVRNKLDANNHRGKKVLAAESWISWDGGRIAVDVNGDGIKNEQDAYSKAVTILGRCLERGLNTVNLPWSDNSSSWAMGLTKRRDYNGRIKSLRPDIVVDASDGGADIVTRKLAIRGSDDNFTIGDGSGDVFTVDNYINPPDPNHLHYYVWKWYAQIAGGSDEVIRHAIAGEVHNDIAVAGTGFTGPERYRLSSYNVSRDQFTVLIYASGANGQAGAKITIPSKIQNGRYYNNTFSQTDFRGAGFENEEKYIARVLTKDISNLNGSDVDQVNFESEIQIVSDEKLTITVPKLNKFTLIEFMKPEANRNP